jgi:hypothetical protein
MSFSMPHWSATRFMLFEQCPALFRARYIDGEPIVVTEAMAFGSALHRGLEAHFNGQDGEHVFRAAWKEYGPVDAYQTRVGLELFEKVAGLRLQGRAEYPFTLETDVALGAPIVGAIDLLGADGVVYDFKSTRGQWSQDRAQTEIWQPILYSWAVSEQTGEFPSAFEYIVLNRVSGRLDRFRRQWTEEQWGQQWGAAYDSMRHIYAAVRDGNFGCHGKHGYCPECGGRWSHEHVCDPADVGLRIRL